MRACILMVMLAGCGRVGFDTHAQTGMPDGTRPDPADPSGDGTASGARLLAHYTFDDDPTDGAADAAGSHASTCDGECPVADVGHVDGSYQFNGATEALAIADSADLHPSAITVSLWLFHNTGIGDGTIASKAYGGAALDSWQLRMTAQLDLEICTTADASTQRCDTMGALTGSAWHHIAYVWDGSVHRAYLDGVKLIEMPATVLYDGGRITIGADFANGATTSYFRGLLDDVRIYAGALTDADIAQLAAN